MGGGGGGGGGGGVVEACSTPCIMIICDGIEATRAIFFKSLYAQVNGHPTKTCFYSSMLSIENMRFLLV